jgi:hypothetical protein
MQPTFLQATPSYRHPSLKKVVQVFTVRGKRPSLSSAAGSASLAHAYMTAPKSKAMSFKSALGLTVAFFIIVFGLLVLTSDGPPPAQAAEYERTPSRYAMSHAEKAHGEKPLESRTSVTRVASR